MCIISWFLRWNNCLFLSFQKEQLEVKESRGHASSGMTEDEVFSKVASLFKGQEDLLAEFGQFLPDAKRSLVSIFPFLRAYCPWSFSVISSLSVQFVFLYCVLSVHWQPPDWERPSEEGRGRGHEQTEQEETQAHAAASHDTTAQGLDLITHLYTSPFS